MARDDDATLVVRPAVRQPAAAKAAPSAPPAPRPARRGPLLLGGACAAALLVAAAAWWILATPSARVAAPSGSVSPAPAAEPALLPAFPVLDEAGILAHRADAPRMIRYAGNPAVFVIDFPTLAAQGAAMNRLAALVEKAGLPRDRVLTEAELAEALARSGETAETWYLGHNYRGVDVARFFRLAARDGIALTPAETWLEARFREARATVPEGSEIAVLTISATEPRVDAAARAAILRHELGHGLLATDPAYAAHVRRVWRDLFSEAERSAFRAFLAREGYDATNEELMLDEAQAYLVHTPDPRFFNAGHVGLTQAQVERLRTLLRDGAPRLR